jgi:hypothetical protein
MAVKTSALYESRKCEILLFQEIECMSFSGPLSKMTTHWWAENEGARTKDAAELLAWLSSGATSPIMLCVSYETPGGTLLQRGQHMSFLHAGRFECVSCGRDTKKLFDGFCFPCLKGKAQADTCVMSPHLCHFGVGTCREPEWGLSFCYKPHFVYLSYTDKFKVGITREPQVPARWIDQGATAATLIARVASRHQAGVLEKILTEIVSDRSHWSNMLKAGNARPSANEVLAKSEEIQKFLATHPKVASGSHLVPFPGDANLRPIEFLPARPVFLEFPLPEVMPLKIASSNLDKSPSLAGEVLGAKGQYLFFAEAVFNVRRHEGYVADVDVN